MLTPTALITTVDSNPLPCDLFHLAGMKMVVYQNTTFTTIDEEVLDLHSLVHNNIKWKKLISVPSNIQTLIDFINNTTKPQEVLVLVVIV